MENHLNFVVALLWRALGYQTSSFFVLLLVPLLGSVFNTGHLFKGQSMLLLVFTWVLTVLLTFQYQLTNFALGVTQQRRNLSEDHSPSEQVTNLHTERTGLGDSLRIAWTSRKANILYYVKTFGDGGLVLLEVLWRHLCLAGMRKLYEQRSSLTLFLPWIIFQDSYYWFVYPGS